MSISEKDVEKLSFEEAMGKLEKLVEKLENGNLDLDKSIEVYNDAVLLRKRCRAILDENERKVQKIIESSDGINKEEFTP